jgi:hypothetical protein
MGKSKSGGGTHSKAGSSRGGKSYGVYTSSGDKVRNPAAYKAAGGRSYSKAGKAVSNPVAYSNSIEASVRQNTDSPKYLYHYTDKTSLGKIESSGELRGSTAPGSVALGRGAYFTAKQPRSSTSGLLTNNYGHAQGRDASKVAGYVRVDADRVSAKSGRDALGRDVWCVPGDGVDLRAAGATYGRRKWQRGRAAEAPRLI